MLYSFRPAPAAWVLLLTGFAPPAVGSAAAVPSFAPPALAEPGGNSPLRASYVSPTRLLWQSKQGVTHATSLLASGKPGQAVLTTSTAPCVLQADGAGSGGGILLDFGVELQGYVELFTPFTQEKASPRARLRFGESASEAMSELGDHGAGNDHAIRDQIVTLPWLGKKTVGPGGFRFVRIDAVDPEHPIALTEVRAVLVTRDLEQVGSFRCDDARLNRIWDVGAYTVFLNMQDYLYDGIKRDRLVWVGDMQPEISTIGAVFGLNDVVPRSLDLARDTTPAGEWMNGISSYSMWWVLMQEQLWLQFGDRSYLEQQRDYLKALLQKLAGMVGPDGRQQLDGEGFLDWPTSANPPAVAAGLQGLLVMTLESGSRLLRTLTENEIARRCAETAARARTVTPDAHGSKAAAALLVLAGLRDAKSTADRVLTVRGAHGISSFFGYYVLQALARAGEIDAALDMIRRYWGAMLDRGATTFWEDFDLDWLEGSGRIDELTPAGTKDLHGDFGAYCYVGFRRSLCHGWASGPTAWLSEQVLGIQPLAPGFARVRVAPRLGGLRWAEGTFPTPRGVIHVRHERRSDGRIASRIDAPPGVSIETDPKLILIDRSAPQTRAEQPAVSVP